MLDRLLDRIALRKSEAAFHPGAGQAVVDGGDTYLALLRTPVGGGSSVLCVHDVSGRPGRFRAVLGDAIVPGSTLADLADGSRHAVTADGTVEVDVPAYGVRWLKPC